MRTAGRWRRWGSWLVRWGGPAIVLLLVAAFAVSLFWILAIIAPSNAVTVGLHPGELGVQWGPIMKVEGQPPRWHIMRVPDHWGFHLAWWPKYFSDPSVRSAGVPLWMPLVLMLVPTVLAWRRHLRPRPGLCPSCSYSLAGLAPGSPCPECGAGRP